MTTDINAPICDSVPAPDSGPGETKNSNLHAARRGKNDEFYTQLTDIEKEVKNYWSRIGHPDERNPFRGKTVLLNCDDPNWSNFWRYFALQFDHLGIKELIATHYEPDGPPSYAMFLDRDANGKRNDYGMEGYVPRGRRVDLEGNGDFRSPECVALLERSDIVVTNPPFSLFREFVGLLMQYEKKFLILGNLNAITYKETFPLIASNQMWFGPSITSGDREFRVPDDYPLKAAGWRIDENGAKYIRVKGVRWFTSLDHQKRHDDLPLAKHYEGHEDEYPRYDNYDAININKTNHIPADYTGVMGVPITFLDKYNPDQFEIVGISGTLAKPLSLNGKRCTGRFYVHGKRLYDRIAIRNRNPEAKVGFRKATA